MRGTSNVPLIMGIIGSVLMLPVLGCSICVGGLLAAVSTTTIDGVPISAEAGALGAGSGFLIIILGLVPVVLGVVGGIKGKSSPNVSFILLLVSAIFVLIGWILVSFTSVFHLVPLILYIFGAVFAKVQRME